MERKKGDLLLSWQKKPVGLYVGEYSYYNFEHSTVFFYGQSNIRKKAFKVLFYTEVGLGGADLRSADLAYAQLQGADLRSADLAYAQLQGANLTGADLEGAELAYADLCGTDLTGAVLYRTNLKDANLSGANLSGAYLRNANLRGADLSNIKYDKDTVWPEGFKP